MVQARNMFLSWFLVLAIIISFSLSPVTVFAAEVDSSVALGYSHSSSSDTSANDNTVNSDSQNDSGTNAGSTNVSEGSSADDSSTDDSSTEGSSSNDNSADDDGDNSDGASSNESTDGPSEGAGDDLGNGQEDSDQEDSDQEDSDQEDSGQEDSDQVDSNQEDSNQEDSDQEDTNQENIAEESNESAENNSGQDTPTSSNIPIMPFQGLYLEETTILEGAALLDGTVNVPLLPTFVLTFNSNVVADHIRYNNKEQISLTDSDGNDVAINIFMEPGTPQPPQPYRRQIRVTPEVELQPLATYTLNIATGMQANNPANTMPLPVTITFTTGDGIDFTNLDPITLEGVTLNTVDGIQIQQGATLVPLNPSFVFAFNQNVAREDATLAANAEHFTLRDSNDAVVPIYVLREGTGNPQNRRIIVEPQAYLQPDSVYTLTVTAGLMSENGRYALQDDISIAFTTGDSFDDYPDDTGNINGPIDITELDPITLEGVTLDTVDGVQIRQGARRVPVNPSFVFAFDQNVARSDEVLASNAEQFSLTNESGVTVPISVSREGTGNPQNRRMIVVPLTTLEAGAIYTINVQAGIISENERYALQHNISITFATVGRDFIILHDVTFHNGFFVLDFYTNNVTGPEYWANNQAAITLYDSNDEEVAVTFTRGLDFIFDNGLPGGNNNIVVQTVSPLEIDASYTLIVRGGPTGVRGPHGYLVIDREVGITNYAGVVAFNLGFSPPDRGTGLNVPYLQTSTIPDGAVNVPLNPVIGLRFRGNITSAYRRQGNMNAVSLRDAAGNNVPISIFMADSSVRDRRWYMDITPVNELLPGTNYILTIDRSLTSQNGLSMAADEVIRFTTAGDPPVDGPGDNQPGDNLPEDNLPGENENGQEDDASTGGGSGGGIFGSIFGGYFGSGIGSDDDSDGDSEDMDDSDTVTPVQIVSISVNDGEVTIYAAQAGEIVYLDITSVTEITTIIENALEAGMDRIVFDLSELDEVVTVIIDTDTIWDFADADLAVEFLLPAGVIALDVAAIMSIVEDASILIWVTLNQKAFEDLTEYQQYALQEGDQVLLIAIETIGYGDDYPQTIQSFDGTITVTVPHEGPFPAAAWNFSYYGERERVPSSYRVGFVLGEYLLDENLFDGYLFDEYLLGEYSSDGSSFNFYNTGKVTFSTSLLSSLFVVGYDEDPYNGIPMPTVPDITREEDLEEEELDFEF